MKLKALAAVIAATPSDGLPVVIHRESRIL